MKYTQLLSRSLHLMHSSLRDCEKKVHQLMGQRTYRLCESDRWLVRVTRQISCLVVTVGHDRYYGGKDG